VAGLAMTVAGRGETAVRWQRAVAERLVAPPAGGPATRPSEPKVIVAATAIAAAGVASWLLLWRFTYALVPVPLAINAVAVAIAPAYGGPRLPWDLWLELRHVTPSVSVWSSHYWASNGDPTLAGAWTYHAAQAFVTYFPLLARASADWLGCKPG
jgi:hypothetical protein